MEEEVKSLSAWRLEIKRVGRKHWLVLYNTFMGVPVTAHARFYNAINMYGEWAMFEAIIAASAMELKGDPFNYVMKVAANKWKEMQLDEDAESTYKEQIEAQKKETLKQNAELAKKLGEKPKRRRRVHESNTF